MNESLTSLSKITTPFTPKAEWITVPIVQLSSPPVSPSTPYLYELILHIPPCSTTDNTTKSRFWKPCNFLSSSRPTHKPLFRSKVPDKSSDFNMKILWYNYFQMEYLLNQQNIWATSYVSETNPTSEISQLMCLHHLLISMKERI